MTLPKSPRASIPPKQRGIIDDLRRRITEGKIRPGERLPTHVELSQEFDVSNVTIQRALGQLANEGFVEARGCSGTFVLERPPHLTHYGMVFNASVNEVVSQFWTALTQEWIKLGAETSDRRVSIYWGVREGGNAEQIAALQDDLQAQRLAGLLLVTARDTFPVIAPHVGRTPVVALNRRDLPGAYPLMFSDTWLERAVSHVAERGRKRVAVLTTSMQGVDYALRAVRTIETAGLVTRSSWVQACSPSAPAWARHCVHLLMDRPDDDRPDALLVADDNLVEEAIGGAIEARVRVPEDLLIVGHCNFPWRIRSVVPTTRLGFDISQLVRMAITTIDAARAGASPSVIELPLVLEHDSAA
jgi:DNA-binding LacI/PurR family transcriptional regulator/DNA-binding transcriptional regulator YhcF (GntR family)